MSNRILVLIVVAGMSTPAIAQIPVGTRVGEAEVPVGTRVGEMPSGYDSGARRDPFMSLVASRRPMPGQTTGIRTGTGLTSFAVADVTVTGIVRKGDAMMAILQGADRQSYVAKVRDRLMDATIKSIDAQGVVFVEVGDPASGIRPQEIRKVLRGAAEVNR